MPSTFEIDPVRKLIRTVWTGELRDENVLDDIAGLQRHPDFHPAYARLDDLRAVTFAEVTPEGMRRIAALDPLPPGTRRAVVVGGSLLFGLARMYEMVTAQSPDAFRVFTGYTDALAWLDLPREGG